MTYGTPTEILIAARMVADFASSDGLLTDSFTERTSCDHLGAVIADSILQAGLDYRSVVLPRIQRIQLKFPGIKSIDTILSLIDKGQTADFLNWRHPVKIRRFESLTKQMSSLGISNQSDLRAALELDSNFSSTIQLVNGVGPKTVDYMACLVGIDSVAVDRHIRNYAKRAGVEVNDYDFLKRVFCFSADLLSVSRRGFDSWVWKRESARSTKQLAFEFS